MEISFTQVNDLDWTTVYCPCGSSWSSRTGDDLSAWKVKHLPHTDGYVNETTTERGLTVYGGDALKEAKDGRRVKVTVETSTTLDAPEES